MRASLDKANRDMVYSVSGAYKIWEWGQPETGANLWRTSADISATWPKVEENGFGENGLEKYAGPGHWNDPDMLEVGRGYLTPDENYTHMTLWCMLSAPLIIGCDMRHFGKLSLIAKFTLSLFSNDEVLAVDQDALGKQGWRAKQDGPKEVWMKPLADGSLAVAFFNRGEAPRMSRSNGWICRSTGRKPCAICGGKRIWACRRQVIRSRWQSTARSCSRCHRRSRATAADSRSGAMVTFAKNSLEKRKKRHQGTQLKVSIWWIAIFTL